MTEALKTFEYRKANINDETDILAVLEEVASEIPVQLDESQKQEKIKTVIIECHKSGKSWVAVDVHGKVVGFILARPDVYEGQSAISVRYVGVRADSRRRRIFSTLMEKLKANDMPLIASVLHNNRSSIVDNLVKIGFTKIGSDARETRLVWSPGGGAS